MSDERSGRRGPEPSQAELVEMVLRKVVTAIVIAGGLIAFGLYSQDVEAPDYQVAASADGRVYRVNTESGSIVACENNVCALIQSGSEDLADKLPVRAQPALPSPTPAAAGNEAGAAAGPAAEPTKR
jgi:hypothetical protein